MLLPDAAVVTVMAPFLDRLFALEATVTRMLALPVPEVVPLHQPGYVTLHAVLHVMLSVNEPPLIGAV